jgi:hypothetical protein
VGFLHIDCFRAEAIKDHKVICEHIWALVIFGGDILCNGFRQRHRMGASKGQLQDVAEKDSSQLVTFISEAFRVRHTMPFFIRREVWKEDSFGWRGAHFSFVDSGAWRLLHGSPKTGWHRILGPPWKIYIVQIPDTQNSTFLDATSCLGYEGSEGFEN